MTQRGRESEILSVPCTSEKTHLGVSVTCGESGAAINDQFACFWPFVVLRNADVTAAANRKTQLHFYCYYNTVSYTHLDVYKRQVAGHAVRGHVL